MTGDPQLHQVCHRTGTDDAPQTHHGVTEGFPSVGQLRDQGTARSPPKPGDCEAAGSGGSEVVKGHGTFPEEWSPMGVSPAEHLAAFTPPELPEESNQSQLWIALWIGDIAVEVPGMLL